MTLYILTSDASNYLVAETSRANLLSLARMLGTPTILLLGEAGAGVAPGIVGKLDRVTNVDTLATRLLS